MNSPISKESKSSRVDQLIQQMFQRIKSKEWVVGEKIPSERTLIKTFGVSRISLRAALAHLSALGMLDIAHGKSTRVRKIDLKVMENLFPLMISLEEEQTFGHLFSARLLIEPETTFLAATYKEKTDIDRLEYLANKYEEHIQLGEIDQAVEADVFLHQAIALASKNPIFSIMLNGISSFMSGLYTVSHKDDEHRRKVSANFHFEIVKAIKAGDASTARNAMRSHLEFSQAGIEQKGYLGTTVNTQKEV